MNTERRFIGMTGCLCFLVILPLYRGREMKVTPQKLNLTANGSFRVLSAKHTEFRCGPHKMSRNIKYTVTIGSRPDLLDHRGFIIDWRDIFKAVALKYRYVNEFPSCESFASEICGIVAGLLENRCASITVDVSIAGLPAHMTAEWDYDDVAAHADVFGTDDPTDYDDD